MTNNFEISSAYSCIASATWSPKNSAWEAIWSLHVPQRVRLFLWCVAQGKLMTNVERCRRFISASTLCSCCNLHPESILHVLRDCPGILTVWKSILPTASQESFFALFDVTEWLSQNLREVSPVENIPWGIVFSAIAWNAWKHRNELVFQGAASLPSSILHRSMLWARYYVEASCFARTLNEKMVRKSLIPHIWNKPPLSFICVNVDGSTRIPSGLGLIGEIFRDDGGDWLLGFQQTVGNATAFTTELWAIWTGLLLAWENGFEKVQVQSDCRLAVEMVMADHAHSSPLPLVRAIAAWRERNWFMKVIWVPRKQNITADKLARTQDYSSRALNLLEQPPSFLLSCLHKDRMSAVPPS